jgi:hypothetical protein
MKERRLRLGCLGEISSLRPAHRKYRLREPVVDITPKNRQGETEWFDGRSRELVSRFDTSPKRRHSPACADLQASSQAASSIQKPPWH